MKKNHVIYFFSEAKTKRRYLDICMKDDRLLSFLSFILYNVCV